MFEIPAEVTSLHLGNDERGLSYVYRRHLVFAFPMSADHVTVPQRSSEALACLIKNWLILKRWLILHTKSDSAQSPRQKASAPRPRQQQHQRHRNNGAQDDKRYRKQQILRVLIYSMKGVLLTLVTRSWHQKGPGRCQGRSERRTFFSLIPPIISYQVFPFTGH